MDEFSTFNFNNNDNYCESVEILTRKVKNVCPMLDYAENFSSNLESSSDNLREIESLLIDKTARKPVESWKYHLYKTEDNRPNYKCSLCPSIYQHKKSLNKHWKDKHFMNLMNENNSIGNTTDNSHISNNNAAMSENQYPFSIKSMENNNNASNIIRKRSSFIMTQSNNDMNDNKENIPPPRKMAMVSAAFQPFTKVERSHSMVLQPTNYSQLNIMSQFMPPHSVNYQQVNPQNNHNNNDYREVQDQEALDLSVGASSKYNNRNNNTKRIYRCFQCNFSAIDNAEDVNSHFVHHHLVMLSNFKAFRISVTMYHRLLFNQFTAVLQLYKDTVGNPFWHERMTCSLCSFEVIGNRAEFIQHFITVHFHQAIWVCVICGTNHRHETHLATHIKQNHLSVVNTMQQKQRIQNVQTQQLPILVPPKPVENSGYVPSVVPNELRRHRTIVGPHLASSTPKMNKMIQNSVNQSREESPTPSSSQDTQQNPSQSSQRTLKCLVCDTTARWRSELFTHMITHSKHRSFGCKFCNYRSKWKWDVPKHLKRCRMAPAAIRHPDVQNSYLITLLQHYAPPPGDILYEFMRQYNIKDIGALNRSSNTNSNSLTNTSPDIAIPSTSNQSHAQTIENTIKSELIENQPIENAYSDISEDFIEEQNHHANLQDEYEEEVDIEGDDSGSPKLLDTSIKDQSLIKIESDYNGGMSHHDYNNEDDCSVSPIPSTSTHIDVDKKPCPWCTQFETNDTQEMIEHIRNKHTL